MKREFVVGIVFFVLVALLLGMTLWIKDPDFMGGAPRHAMSARFRDVAGLKVNDEVRVYGTKAGRVLSIVPDGNRYVVVDMALDDDPQLREDATVTVGPGSALGGAVVSIDPGTSTTPRPAAGVIEGTKSGGVFDQVNETVDAKLAPVAEAAEEFRALAAELREGKGTLGKLLTDDSVYETLSKTLDSLKTASDNAAEITTNVREGKGTLGKLLSDDDTVYNDLRDAIASLKIEKNSTLDMLLHDQALSADLKSSVSNIRSVTDKMDRGSGSLGRLLNDAALYDDLAATAADLRDVAAAAKSGQGVLGKLLYDAELGDRIDRISKDMAQVSGRLRRGEGTLGKLIQDEELYVELRDSLKALTAGAGDARENAPILTFASFLFGGF